jgi:hypothetical protein
MKRLLLLLLLPLAVFAQGPPAQPVVLAWDTPVIESSLIGTFALSSETVSLTNIGVTDWINWYTTVNRKVTGGSQISNLTITGTVEPTAGGRVMSWTDGMPTIANATDNVLWIKDAGNGYSFTVPADTIPRTITVYLGVWSSASARITATLSADDPEPDLVYTDTIPLVVMPDFTDTRNYTFTYRASKPNQRLTIDFRSLGGWIYLTSAALVQGVPDWYNLYRSEQQGQYSGVVAGNIKTLTYTDTSILRGKTYYYIVRTANTGVESINSNEVMVVIPNQPSRPNAPINLRVISPVPK